MNTVEQKPSSLRGFVKIQANKTIQMLYLQSQAEEVSPHSGYCGGDFQVSISEDNSEMTLLKIKVKHPQLHQHQHS